MCAKLFDCGCLLSSLLPGWSRGGGCEMIVAVRVTIFLAVHVQSFHIGHTWPILLCREDCANRDWWISEYDWFRPWLGRVCLEDLAPFHKTLPFPARAEMGKTLGLVQLAHPSYHPAATHTGFIDVMPFYCGMGWCDCRHLAFMQLGLAFTDGVWLLPRVYATLFHTRLASLSPPTEHLCPVAASQFHSAARIPLRFLPRKPTSAVGSSQLWSGAVGSCTTVETRVESGLFWLHMLEGGKEFETRTASLALHFWSPVSV